MNLIVLKPSLNKFMKILSCVLYVLQFCLSIIFSLNFDKSIIIYKFYM
jgi:hypothetical protein